MSASRQKKVLDKKSSVVEKTSLRQTIEKLCQIKQNYTEIRLKAKVPKNQ